MSRSFRRPLLALTAATGGLLAALTSSYIASADEWVIAPSYGTLPDILSESGYPPLETAAASPADSVVGIVGTPDFDFIPDPDDGPVVVTSTAGFAPLYTTVQEQGFFTTDSQLVFGNASFYSDMFGDHSTLFDRFYNGEVTQVIDQFNFGNSGFENIYDEVVGAGANGTNSITDTFVTPFGDVNIPTTYDAAALLDVGGVAPGAATDWLGVLEADWTTLVTDFGALF